MQPDSAVNSLLSAMSNTCFLLDRVLLSLGYVQCNLMTLKFNIPSVWARIVSSV